MSWQGQALVLGMLASASLASGATFLVDRTDDSAAATNCSVLVGGDCSLRGAIIRANQTFEHDEIRLSPGTYTLTIAGTDEELAATGDLDVFCDLTIRGSSEGESIINANGIDRVLDIWDLAKVTLVQVTLEGGSVPGEDGGGIRLVGGTPHVALERCTIRNNSADEGGGIYAWGGASFKFSTISNNMAQSRGGGIFSLQPLFLLDSRVFLNEADSGGGLFHSGDSAFVWRSEIFGNKVSNNGAGVYNHNSMVMSNCTLYLNFALTGKGGAIASDGFLLVDRTTITGNLSAGNSSSVVWNAAGKDLTFKGSILQGTCDTALADVSSSGYNLESPGDSCGLVDTTDRVAVSDLMLGTVDFHGGLTRSFSLSPGSPAIDIGGGSELTTDQRGWPRFVDGDGNGTAQTDSGAYEYNPSMLFLDRFESGSLDTWSSSTP